ncbi:MAG: hypothetical protein WBW03_11390, partial [Silvibacterium sp.]
IAYLIPIDFADVESKRYPASGGEVGGQIEAAGLRLGERVVLAWHYLAGDCHHAVSVMVVEEVGEGLFPDEELCVRPVDLTYGLREREGDLSQACEARVFYGTLWGSGFQDKGRFSS